MIYALSLYSDKGNLGEYRVKLPAQAVTEKRLETGVQIEPSNTLDVAFRNGRVSRVNVPGGINVISFQRPAKEAVSDVIVWLRHFRPDIGIVVDIDDQLPELDTDKFLRRSVALADVLTVSTQQLADRYGYDSNRTFVLRSAVHLSALDNPSSALNRKRSKADVSIDRTVGWAGNAVAQLEDLQQTRGALAAVVGVGRRDGRSVAFRSIGPRDGLSEALSLPEDCIEVPNMILPAGLHRVALGEIDIGISPQACETAGSTLALEFAAAGVPVIASDTSEHRILLDQGMPLRLVSPHKKYWTQALKEIISMEDRELKDLASAHRENVRQYHTTERRAYQWANAFRTAYRLTKES